MSGALTFTDRCAIAAGCLPKADYRTKLEALHAEMLDALELAQKYSEHCNSLIAAYKDVADHACTTSAVVDRVPLTDDKILDAYCKAPDMRQYITAFKAGARFAEAAHGITAAKDKP